MLLEKSRTREENLRVLISFHSGAWLDYIELAGNLSIRFRVFISCPVDETPFTDTSDFLWPKLRVRAKCMVQKHCTLYSEYLCSAHNYDFMVHVPRLG